MALRRIRRCNWDTLCAQLPPTETIAEYRQNRIIFQQGQPADSLFYLRRGRVKLAVLSRHGREGIIASLDAGEFFGEGCLAGQRLRRATATALIKCTVGRIERRLMARLLHDRHDISAWFVEHLLSRNIRYEADLVDLLFNSTEKRLARVLLVLSRLGEASRAEVVVPHHSQASLAELVGTSRSRVSRLMSRFRASGFIDYAEGGGLRVHGGLLNVVLHD